MYQYVYCFRLTHANPFHFIFEHRRGCALFTFGEDGLIHDIWALNDDSDLEEKLKTNKSLMHT